MPMETTDADPPAHELTGLWVHVPEGATGSRLMCVCHFFGFSHAACLPSAQGPSSFLFGILSLPHGLVVPNEES